MKIFKKLLLSIMIVITTLTMSSVAMLELPSTSVVEAASIRINKTKYTMKKGSTYTLKITGTKKKVKWTSSNKKVATVNSKGKVTAKKKGTCTITAKIGNKKYKCKITVKNKAATTTKSRTVYITNTGSKYHSSGCRYLRKSKIAISLNNAKNSGYTACSRCNP